MPAIASATLAVATVAALILAIGGMRLLRSDRQRGALMIVAALVLLGNVLIWTI